MQLHNPSPLDVPIYNPEIDASFPEEDDSIDELDLPVITTEDID